MGALPVLLELLQDDEPANAEARRAAAALLTVLPLRAARQTLERSLGTDDARYSHLAQRALAAFDRAYPYG